MDQKDLGAICEGIRERVIKHGDAALLDMTTEFDRIDLKSVVLTPEQIASGAAKTPPELQTAIDVAMRNVATFHQQQKCSTFKVETTAGVTCWQEQRPIENVGLYVPGGLAPLFSTAIMLTVPAKVAGCKTIHICTPPQKNGEVFPAVLYIAQKLGITSISPIGGAQAIFAMAHGTESIPKVDKIFGPGNQFVTQAKIMIQHMLPIDMPAGPSEVLVIADDAANPAFVAADLLSQAEHAPDSQVVLLCLSKSFAEQVQARVKEQLAELDRKQIATEVIQNSFAVVCLNLDQAIGFSNAYAPEHLILQTQDWQRLVPIITSAGSVFCGAYSPETAGDYASGTNHVIPTAGFCRSYSALSLDSFMKKISFQHLTKPGLNKLRSTLETLAAAEGLTAHKNAVSIRLADL